MDKLRTFKTFKEAYKLENYLSIGIEMEKVFKSAKLRISNHQLENEQAFQCRYKKIPPGNRFCMVGDGQVENEFHFIMKCKTYDQLRNQIFKELNTFIAPFRDFRHTETFQFLMGTNDTEVLEMFVKFVECFYLRNSSGK